MISILTTGIIAGILDIGAAMLLYLARGGKNPLVILEFIASGIYGKAAFAGGGKIAGNGKMRILGLLFHLLIALAFVAFYGLVLVRIKWLYAHPPAGAIIYGLVVWMVMNLIVLPLSNTAPRPTSVSFILINMVILIVTIGLPAAYLTGKM